MGEKAMTVSDLLMENREEEYALFEAKLAPTLPKEVFLGSRVPRLRAIEKQLRGTEEAEEFLRSLPHRYYDENLLHSILLSNRKDYAAVLAALDEFLPYVDNWAVCDTLNPKIFAKHREELLLKVREWIASPAPFTCRFGIDMLMTYYLDEAFLPEYAELPAAVRSEEYYVNMMIAWYYATALAKQWDSVIPFLEEERLSVWVHNKTIQKAIESYRITEEQKTYLRTLRRH